VVAVFETGLSRVLPFFVWVLIVVFFSGFLCGTIAFMLPCWIFLLLIGA
jgi:hypothetical protein